MIHNTKSRQEIGELTKIKSHSVRRITKLFKDTFGQKPNIENLRAFFRIDFIQRLWFSERGFYHS